MAARQREPLSPEDVMEEGSGAGAESSHRTVLFVPCMILCSRKEMENILLALKSMSAGWLSSSPTSWTTGTTFAFLCGLWLFLLLISCFQTDPSSSPPRRKHRLSRKQVELRRRSIRDKKKSELLKACRDCLQELDGVRDLVSLLQSHLERRPDQGGLPQPLGQEGPGDVCEAAPAGAQRPCGGPVKDAAPTMPGSASPTPTQHSPHLASLLPTEPQEEQSNLKGTSQDTVTKSSPPGTSPRTPKDFFTLETM
ncbi:spermatogenesis-associated protein 31E1-like [Crocuta crocuta]